MLELADKQDLESCARKSVEVRSLSWALKKSLMKSQDLISDQHRKNRGGWSRILSISCASCNKFLFHYQKDGPGPLKRSYFDRIIGRNLLIDQKDWVYCPQCKICLGFNEPYIKEDNRPALRWASEAIRYKIIPLRKAKVER